MADATAAKGLTAGELATKAANEALGSLEFNTPIKVTVGDKKYNVEVKPNTSKGGRRNKRKGTRRNKRKGTRRNKRKGTRRNKRN
jgi:hypothetical protein